MCAKLAIGLPAVLVTTALAEAQGIGDAYSLAATADSDATIHQFSFCGYDKGSDTFYCGNNKFAVTGAQVSDPVYRRGALQPLQPRGASVPVPPSHRSKKHAVPTRPSRSCSLAYRSCPTDQPAQRSAARKSNANGQLFKAR